MNAATELNETRTLVRLLHQTVENYRTTITPRTGDEATAKAAADRAEEALIECMRKAADELAVAAGDSFHCAVCGGLHDLTRDRAALQSGKHREPILRGTAEEQRRPVGEHVVLMRAHRYGYAHAKEVVRQLELRGWKPGRSENRESRIEDGGPATALPMKGCYHAPFWTTGTVRPA